MKILKLLKTAGTVLILSLLFLFEAPDSKAGMYEANNISRLEYFFDTDPGYGKGTPIEFNPGSKIIFDETIPVNSLDEGIHIFYIRACDDEGHWSQTYNKIFLKTQLQTDNSYNVKRVEYFFDTDPGFGNGISANFTLNDNILLENTWSTNSLDNGIHKLYVRALDEYGQWSQTYNRLFFKTQLNSNEAIIEEVEYFFDTDPGYGNGINIPVQQGERITVEQLISVENLSNGLHHLYVRCKYANNIWSQLFHRGFYKYPAYDVVKVEYYFDDDPGYGNGIDLPLTPAESVIIDDEVQIQSLTSGNHTFYVRALSENDIWSQIYSYSITVLGGTGIDDFENSKSFVRVYPNPTDGLLNVEVNRINSPIEVQLVSVNGSILLNNKIFVDSNTLFDLSSFTDGVYILRFQYGDELSTQSIVLKK